MTTTYASMGTFQSDAGNDFLHLVNSSGTILYAIDQNGKEIVVGGLTTAGVGQAAIVAAVSLAAQGFAVFNTAAAVNLLPSTAPAGTYRVDIYLVETTTFVTNTTTNISIGFTDDSGAQTPVVVTTSTLTAGTAVSASYTFRSAGGAAITYTPGKTGSAATAGAAAFSVVLTRLI